MRAQWASLYYLGGPFSKRGDQERAPQKAFKPLCTVHSVRNQCLIKWLCKIYIYFSCTDLQLRRSRRQICFSSFKISTYNFKSTTDLSHKWWLINYSFIFMLINLTSLVSTCKIQKNVYSKMRLVGLINIPYLFDYRPRDFFTKSSQI